MSKVDRMLALVTEPAKPAFPPATGRHAVVAVAVALLAAAGTIAALLSLVGQADWWRGLLAASVVSVLAAALSLAPLVWCLRRSLNVAIAGYFLAMGVRAAVSVGGSLIAVKAGGYPAAPTLLLMAVLYAAALAAEAIVVASAAWSAANATADVENKEKRSGGGTTDAAGTSAG